MLSAQDALVMIARCKERRVAILRIDAFVLTPTSTQPSLQNSVDFSSMGKQMDATMREEAEAFVRDRISTGLRFEIVTADQ